MSEQKPEPNYPCEKCGRPRTKAEGGTTFTVCDACWDQKPDVTPETVDIALFQELARHCHSYSQVQLAIAFEKAVARIEADAAEIGRLNEQLKLIQQVTGDYCNVCGWAMKHGDECLLCVWTIHTAEIAALRASRDELVEVLDDLCVDANRLCDRNLGSSYEDDCRQSVAHARRAIANAERSKP